MFRFSGGVRVPVTHTHNVLLLNRQPPRLNFCENTQGHFPPVTSHFLENNREAEAEWKLPQLQL